MIKYCSLWSTYCNSRRNSTYWPHPSREDTGIVVREVTSREGALHVTPVYHLYHSDDDDNDDNDDDDSNDDNDSHDDDDSHDDNDDTV